MSSAEEEKEETEDLEINGIAHVLLTAGDFDASREFYARAN